MNNLFIILASGKSKRFKSKTPKQFNIYKNKPIYGHSVDKALKSKLFNKIILVTNVPNRIIIKDKNLLIIKGGKERSDSSLNACLLYTSPSPRDRTRSRMPSSA